MTKRPSKSEIDQYTELFGEKGPRLLLDGVSIEDALLAERREYVAAQETRRAEFRETIAAKNEIIAQLKNDLHEVKKMLGNEPRETRWPASQPVPPEDHLATG